MPLPAYDISRQTSQVAAISLDSPRALTESAAVARRTSEEWGFVARASISEIVRAVTNDKHAASYAVMGAATYSVVSDLEQVLGGQDGGQFGHSLRVNRTGATLSDLVSVPADVAQTYIINALIDLGNETPLLAEAIGHAAGFVDDSPEARRHVLSGAAFMRAYHLAALLKSGDLREL